MKSKYYAGKIQSSMSTATQTKPSPAIKWLFKEKFIRYTDKVLDYGCGRTARNADWLRVKIGVPTYAYDPYWGVPMLGGAAWLKEYISDEIPPLEKFDVVFTSFVLNVVTKKEQDKIIKHCKELAPIQIHIVRNDTIEAAEKAIRRQVNPTYSFFIYEFQGNPESPVDVTNLAYYGFSTSRGFQRHITEIQGYKTIKSTHNYRIFMK